MAISESPKVLVLIDVQKGFLSEHTESALDKVAELAEVATANGVEIFATQFVNPQNSLWEQHLDWAEMRGGAEIELAEVLDENSLTTVKKGSYALPPELHSKLSGQPSVYIAGFDTEACVMAAAFQLFDSGIMPVIVADACASSGDPELHEAALAMLRATMGEDQVVTVGALTLNR